MGFLGGISFKKLLLKPIKFPDKLAEHCKRKICKVILIPLFCICILGMGSL